MPRVITGVITEPGLETITGSISFEAVQSSTGIPITTRSEIAVVDGAYTGTIANGVYIIKLTYPDPFLDTNRVAVLGRDVAVIDGADIDVLTLAGLDAIPESVVQGIANAALVSQQAAAASELAAEHWAQYTENVLVPEGNLIDEYSAYHYSRKTAADLLATNQDTLDTAADAFATNADRVNINTRLDTVQANTQTVEANLSTITSEPTATLLANSQINATLTSDNLVLTHADVVLTNADVITANNAAASAQDNDTNTAVQLANAGSMLGINFGSFNIIDGELWVSHLTTTTPILDDGELILTYEALPLL